MGIVGLGGWPLSTSSQFAASLGSNRFSYCLVPFNTDPSITGKMYFGPGSEVSGNGTSSVPLIPKDDPTYYFVTVTGISVACKFFPYNSSGKVSPGNMLVDSGTPPTIIPVDLYKKVESEVQRSIRMTPYVDPELGTQLCHPSVVIAPILSIHFEGGVQLAMGPRSTFVSPKDSVFCFAMVHTSSSVGVIGNFSQTNYRIGFDLERTFNFRKLDCTLDQ